MKPIETADRKVANVKDGTFETFLDSKGGYDGDVLQINPNQKRGHGFHIYRMNAGHTTVAHAHVGDEEFFVLEGEVVDHDGFRYGPGDLVWLRSGTSHNSFSPDGALLVVHLPGSAQPSDD